MSCEHKNTIEKEVVFKNNTKHIESRCADCGRHLKYLPQPIELTAEQLPEHVLMFGKHNGRRLADIPKDYLEWMVRENVRGKDARIAKLYLDLLAKDLANKLRIDR